jgi:hypothetical protein
MISSVIQYYGYYLNNLKGCSVGIIELRDLLCMLLRWSQMAWYTYQVSWQLVQAFKSHNRHYLNNLRGWSVGTEWMNDCIKGRSRQALAPPPSIIYCSVRIRNKSDFWCMPLRWPLVAWQPIKFHEDGYRYSSNNMNLPEQFKRLYCWYYWWEGFTKYATEMRSGGVIYIPGFIHIRSSIQKLFREHTARWSHTCFTFLYIRKAG